jgi:hypothetical protein
MNKTQGNTVYLDGNPEDTVINKMIDDSYNLVYKSLRRKIKPELEEQVETCSLIYIMYKYSLLQLFPIHRYDLALFLCSYNLSNWTLYNFHMFTTTSFYPDISCYIIRFTDNISGDFLCSKLI